jgi:hypothetical protein
MLQLKRGLEGGMIRETADTYLKRAAELRAVADQLNARESRNSLIRAAEECERMAARLQAENSAPKPGGSTPTQNLLRKF